MLRVCNTYGYAGCLARNITIWAGFQTGHDGGLNGVNGGSCGRGLILRRGSGCLLGVSNGEKAGNDGGSETHFE